VARAEGAPEEAPLAAQPPAGLVHVDVAGAADGGEQVRVGRLERVAGALQDRLDAARAEPRREQLLAALDDIAARDPVAHRQRHDRRLQPGPERARGDLRRQPAGLADAAVRAAHALTAVLGHACRHHRQLLDLMARRLGDRDPLRLAEHVPARAPRGPMLDHLIDRPRRQQRAPVALVAGLAALRATRPARAAPRRRPRRILTGRRRRVARVATQPALELTDPLLLLSDPLAQPLDLLVHPQQHRHDDLAALVVDRLRLGAFHASTFDDRRLCPPNRLNAYRKSANCRLLSLSHLSTRSH
jgi:hypothetical protein